VTMATLSSRTPMLFSWFRTKASRESTSYRPRVDARETGAVG